VTFLKAAVFYGPGKLILEERSIPQPSLGEIVVKVDTSGLCPTDVKIYKFGSQNVKIPIVLGHEFSGKIYSLPSDIISFKEGERVVIPADAYCGKCLMCISSKENLCFDTISFGYQIDGAHAEYVLIPKRFLDRGGVFKVPENISLEIMSMTEPLACAVHDIKLMKIDPSKRLLVVGDGPMGLLHVLVAKNFGCSEIVVVGLFDWKLKLASELGATHTINSQEIKDVKKEIKSLYQEGVDACALTVVTKDTIVQSLGSTIKGGYVSIFAGVPKDSVYTTLDPNIIHYNEISLIGSSGYTYEDFRIAFKIAINNESKLSRLVPHRFRLDDIHDAITAWEDKERSLKILLKR